MKLKATINLEPLRESVTLKCNAAFADKAADTSAFPVAHAFKADDAREMIAAGAVPPDSYLAKEAALRGVAALDLCRTILDAEARHKEAVLKLELGRQRILARVRAATSQQELERLLAIINP